jgi:hypothetical protein
MMSGYVGDDDRTRPPTASSHRRPGHDRRARQPDHHRRIKFLIDVGGLKVNPMESSRRWPSIRRRRVRGRAACG